MGKLQADHENCEKTSKSNFHFFRDAKFPFGVLTYLWATVKERLDWL